MNDTVVPFRPRDQVSRPIRSFRSETPEFPLIASAPMRIEGTVVLWRLIRGLRSVGLTFLRDERTGEFVLMPDPEAQP